MSLTPLFLEGFEQYTTASNVTIPSPSQWDTANASVGTASGRFGGIGATVSFAGFTKTLPTATSVAGVGLAATINATTQLQLLVFYDSAGTGQATVTRNVDGSVSVYRGVLSSLLVTSAAAVLPTGTFHHLECQIKIDPTSGTADVWVDGICVISSSGLNTRGSAVVGSNCAKIAIHTNNATGSSAYDDIVFYDAASRTGASGAGTPSASTFEHYGDKRVQTLLPNGAGTGNVGTFTQTGGTGGSPYTAVSDRPADSTSYVADATAGDIISFTLDDLASGTTGVAAIAAVASWEKDDATSRSCAVGVRNSSTNAFGATRGAPSSYAYSQDIRTTDATGAALSPTIVNGMELLFKVVS